MAKIPKRVATKRIQSDSPPKNAPIKDIPRYRIVGSRYPRIGQDYDAVTHRYQDDYIDPDGYDLVVDARPGEEIISTHAALKGQGDGDGSEPVPVSTLKLKIPDDTIAIEFSVAQVNGTKQFSNRKRNLVGSLTRNSDEPMPSLDIWGWKLKVPGKGIYDFSVKLANKNGGGPQIVKRVNLHEFLIVSIGDSSASGQGNPDVPGSPEDCDGVDIGWLDIINPIGLLYKATQAGIDCIAKMIVKTWTTFARFINARIPMDPAPIWLEKEAYRSLRSGPALAALQLENISNGRLITFLPFARTGSDINNGLINPRTDDDGKSIDGWIGDIGQVQEVKNTLGTRRIDALLINIGVNDLGITSTLTNLVTSDLGFGSDEDDAAARREVERRSAERLAKLPESFDRLKEALSALNIRHIYLVEYPVGLFDLENGQSGAGCGIFSQALDCDLTLADARLVKEVAEKLNLKLKAEAERLGWFFVSGIAERFTGHGYCSDVSFFVKAEESLIVQGDTEGTVHPNLVGHQVIAEQIAVMVKKHTLDVADLEEVLDPVVTQAPGGEFK
jgi:hypothetical protein